ncbi:MAG: right-handed parallel beta-helix repeat-containing protein [Anaerolineaceae bacterium]|nr:right-handed parallel beta-helix repeat-containing protein [Anaerolineaceae bacterium]
MKTIQPTNQLVLNEDTRLEPGTYLLSDGIIIAESGITLDGNGAKLIGNGQSGIGIRLNGLQDVTLKNLQISGFTQGIQAIDCQELTITNCRIRECSAGINGSSPGSPWHPTKSFPCGIFLGSVGKSQINRNDLQCQSNGLVAVSCRELAVKNNIASHNPGFGFILNGTSESTFLKNQANHCASDLTKHPAFVKTSEHSAGFILLNGSENNTFKLNEARLCAAGFRLEGLTPDGETAPCSGNRFEGNDASHCVFSSFADHFNQNNHYLQNEASHSNTGFDMTGVSGATLERNTLVGNYKAGIAAVNSVHCDVINNTLQDNRFGILLWSRPDEMTQSLHPENNTSKFWDIRNNTLLRNHTGIRIAADQVAGLTPLSANLTGQLPKPHDHEIQQNVISDNRIGIQTFEAERTIIKDNQFELNLLGDIKS